MNTSGEVADLMVKEGLQITEEVAKLAGLGAKNLAAIIIALLKEDNKLQGKTNLKKLLKSDKPLCILQIKEKDIGKFNNEAKKYGVLFTAVKDNTNNTDNSGKAKADVVVTLKDRNGKSESGTTDKKGTLILPGVTHTAYVFGYPNGEFRPDGDMLRSEAAAIFARLISERKGEEISGRATFSDVKPSEWYYSYVGYLEDYDVIRGYTDNTFRADEPVSRAEFVAMTVRFYDIFEDVKKTGYTVNYSDVSSRYWAYNDIAFAKNIGWLNGYADGTFKGDNNITRAEVVTVTNHATDRTPDEDYINRNVSTLNKFTDLKNNSHWAYYDIMEAANTHIGAVSDDAESWVK